MTEPLHVEAGELDAEEILSALDDGHRVVIRTKMLGSDYEVTLRHDGSVYYCDTPTTLHRHETRDGMRRCISNQGYGRTDEI
jgi:hemin uptake protein HemP